MPSTGTGVVIGSHSLKVVQARKKGGVIRLTRVANLKFDPNWAERPMDAKKEEYIASQLRSLGLKPCEAMLGITGRDLIIRFTHVPPVPDWRLDMLMKFEIEEVSEQSGGEVSADWARLDLPESMTGDNTILVSLAKNAALIPRIETLGRANLKIRGACPNAIGMEYAFVSTAKLPPGEVTLLMHIGAENTDIAIQKDGRLLFARNVSGGGRLFTEAIMNQFRVNYDRAEKMKAQKADVTPKSSARYEDSLSEKVSNAVIGVTGQFVSMVHSSVMFCKAQTKLQDLSVDRVVIAGGGANLKGLADYLTTNLGVPVEVFDPTAAVDTSALAPEEQGVLDADGPGLAVAIGLAALSMDSSAFRIEILPEEQRRKRQFMERELFMLGAGAIVALLIAILFYTSARDHRAAAAEADQLWQRTEDLQKKQADFTAAREKYEKVQRRWRVLRDEARTGPSVVQAVLLLAKVIHENEFKEIHISSLTTETVALAEERDPNAPPLGPDETVQKILYVKVNVKAEIQMLGRPAGRIISDFMSALKERAATVPTMEIKDEKIQRDKNVQFTIWFSPPDEPAEGEGK